MRTMLALSAILLVAVMLVGCGGGAKGLPDVGVGPIPAWFTNLPQDPNYFFATATATSRDMQIAINSATTNARAEISRQVEARVSGMQKQFTEEVGIDEDAQLLQMFTQATRIVTDNALSGSRVREQTFHRDGNMFRAYVLVEYPIGAANQALLQQLKQQEQMYTRFRATEAFKELEKEVENYEEWQKRQR